MLIENDASQTLRRAPHIVQRFYTEHHPRVNPPRTRFSPRQTAAVADMAEKIDGHQGSWFLMEFCKFGSLESQLHKAARDMNGTERYFPESVLWRFFDCLVKSCMAMEEPPRLNPTNGAVPLSVRGGFLPEVLTPVNPGREGLVHLDLVSLLAFISNLAGLIRFPRETSPMARVYPFTPYSASKRVSGQKCNYPRLVSCPTSP